MAMTRLSLSLWPGVDHQLFASLVAARHDIQSTFHPADRVNLTLGCGQVIEGCRRPSAEEPENLGVQTSGGSRPIGPLEQYSPGGERIEQMFREISPGIETSFLCAKIRVCRNISSA